MHRSRRGTLGRRRAILLVLLLAGCSQSVGSGARDTPVTGTWGGEHLRLELTSTGGEAEYDCAHGGLREPLMVDARGTFDVAGVHVREHGGPVRDGENVDSLPARFAGRVDGDRMTLRVFVGARPDTLGPFQLTRGAEARVLKCL